MSQDKIESRRVFMKKLGNLTGIAAIAAPFMTMAAREAVAQPDEDNQPTQYCRYCSTGCMAVCAADGGCSGTCKYSCNHTCLGTCDGIGQF